ncbi:hypothetical protein EYF80_064048 [Liparis tanakae]|uniref:Uncharacterized protein n=1 Tax=Liparis tanakae TaxID=230148 RepID=A0A4Z2EB85_9TELE|nr:hypothetical protein EYF80_064048 [Liparis tanakae]
MRPSGGPVAPVTRPSGRQRATLDALIASIWLLGLPATLGSLSRGGCSDIPVPVDMEWPSSVRQAALANRAAPARQQC